MPGKVIIVEGIIGAGKSSLTKELSVALGRNTLTLMEPDEKDEANPYLADFYEDPRRWAFTMQVHLLQARYRMHLNAQWHAINSQGHAVLDRSYFGDTAFARLQLKTGAMSQMEFNTYQSIYHAMTASVLLPNVCVQLVVSPETAQKRISRRMELETGRKCESVIELPYLQSLSKEIDNMVGVLSQQGVTVLSLPWDVDLDSPDLRREFVSKIATQILDLKPADMFLDLHRRTV
jgi:deoxyadenosine/deoxycytidine kinase